MSRGHALTGNAFAIQRAKKEYFFHVYSWFNKDGQDQEGEENWEDLIPTEKLNIEGHGPQYVVHVVCHRLLLTCVCA